jgi:acyl-CoA synthetase (AMP-forming)/AMP-acid ligase II
MQSSERSLQAKLLERWQLRPDVPALAWFDSQRNITWYDFRSVVERAAAPQAVLREAGLSPGDVTMIVMSDPATSSNTLLGVLMAGGVPLLVAPPVIQGSRSSLADIFRGVFEKTQTRLVVYENETLASQLHPPGVAACAIDASRFPEQATSGYRIVDRPADSVAALQLTSGTTGFPRVCVWTHRKIQAALDGMARAMDVGPRDTFLNWTPLYHDMGLINNLMLCLLHEIPLVMMSPFDLIKNPALWLQALSDTGATTSWSPNFGFALVTQRATREQLAGVRLDRVRGLWNAAERIHYSTLLEFRERFEPYGLSAEAIKTNFGCAENIGGATFSNPEDGYHVEMIDPVALHERQQAVPAPAGQEAMAVVGVGKGHPGLTIQILDPQGRPLPDGHVGEVALHTCSRMEGYWGDPEATDRAFAGELLKTGDLGYLRDGELFWTGRLRECIVSRGRKIDPSDFESRLLAVPDLRPGCFVAFGVANPDQGTDQIVIVSEVRGDLQRPPAEVRREVAAAVARELGPLSLGDFVLVKRGTLTKTSSGKRRHRYFRERYLAGELETHRAEFHVAADAEATSGGSARAS